MSNATDKTSCLRHRAKTRFFVFYEDLQDISRAAGKKHMDKVAAHLRVLETKTNDRETYNEQVIEDARKQGLPTPETSPWIEIPYSEFVRRSLHTFERSSFQVAEKEAQKLLFSKSRVQQRHRVPTDPDSPLEDYKEYLLVKENVQAALDGKELPITGIVFDCYPQPVLNSTPPVIFNSPPIENNTSGIESNSPPVLNSTAPPVKNNTLKNLEESTKNREKNDEEGDTGALAPTPPPVPARAEIISLSGRISESQARLKAIQAKARPDFEVTPEMEVPSQGDGLDSTQRMRAVHPQGDNDAAVHAAGDRLPAADPSERMGAGALPGVRPTGAAAGPVRAAPVAGGTDTNETTPVAPSPQTVRGATDALVGGGAAPPRDAGFPLSPRSSSSISEPRVPGASDPPRSLTRKQQDKLNEQVTAQYWMVIEAWKGAAYTRDQRKSASHTSGIEAMLANGILPDDLKARLAKLDAFQRRTFTVSKLYLEWWNNLDEAQPAKPAKGKAGKSKSTAYDGQTDMDTYGFGQNDEAQMEKFRKLGVSA